MQDAHDTLVHFSSKQMACKERKSLLHQVKQQLMWSELRYSEQNLN